MREQLPFSAKRLHALIGDKIHAFPPYFIERLERNLELQELQHARAALPARLQVVLDAEQPRQPLTADGSTRRDAGGKVAIRVTTLQGLDAILEILHSVHVAQQEGEPGSVIGEHLVDGLIMAARSLARDSTGAVWGDA